MIVLPSRSHASLLSRHFTKVMQLKKVKGKGKVHIVQALRLCAGRTAHTGSRGIAILFLDHGTGRGCGVSVTPRLLFTPGKDPVPIVQEAGWAPGPVWTGAENLAPTGIGSPDRPTRSQSLYRLRYADHMQLKRRCEITMSKKIISLYLYHPPLCVTQKTNCYMAIMTEDFTALQRLSHNL